MSKSILPQSNYVDIKKGSFEKTKFLACYNPYKSNQNLVTFNFVEYFQSLVMSVTQKNKQCAVVYYYCTWYTFLRNRHLS